MKQTVSLNIFINAFSDHNRQDNFTYLGFEALYDYLTNLEDECDIEVELDVIGLCGEFTEYEDLLEYNTEYKPVESIDAIADITTVIEIDNSDGFIIQAY